MPFLVRGLGTHGTAVSKVQGPVSKWSLRRDLLLKLRHLEVEPMLSDWPNLKMSELEQRISSQAPLGNWTLESVRAGSAHAGWPRATGGDIHVYIVHSTPCNLGLCCIWPFIVRTGCLPPRSAADSALIYIPQCKPWRLMCGYNQVQTQAIWHAPR